MNIIIQTCVPSYRLRFYQYLAKNTDDFNIYAGKEFYTNTVKSDINTPNVKWLKNLFLFNRKILFQNIPLLPLIKANNVVIEFNLRNISFYYVFLVRKIFRKKIYLWGHAWSRKGQKSRSEYLRYFFKRYSTGFIGYTNNQKKQLENQLSQKEISAACNSIFYKNELYPIIKDSNEITNFIYVGRLVSEKKIFTLVKAFKTIIEKLSEECKLVIVGDGDEYLGIEKYIEKNNLTNKILLLGHISDYDKLKDLYSNAIASISPGYVGLSITQSLGFGVPMIISKNENHSPEIEAASNDNSLFFETDNIASLSDTLLKIEKNKEEWIIKRKEISLFCRDNYSIEKMANPFIKIFNND